MTSERVCIIGAGSSGIVAAKVLQEQGVPYDCFEKGSGIGGNWRYQNDNGMSAAYKSLHINTSKTRMAYSDFPMPEDYPDYCHHSQILEYFESYVDHFGVRPHIRFRTAVEDVAPAAGGGWRVTLEGGEQREYRAVLVANGHHWSPKSASFPGHFDGRALHSHDYKTPAGLEGKNVLVVGIGNSGVDIACESSRVAARTFLSTRRSAHILPKYAFGRPIDTFTTPAGSRLPLAIQRLFFTLILKITRGPQTTFGVPDPKHNILQAHPTISAELLHLAGHGKLHMKPDIEELRGDAVRFADGSEEKIDVVIYATGYKISFPFFRPEVLAAPENELRLYHHVVHPRLAGLYFLGLIQPLGAIMPLAEAQSKWIARLLTGSCALPDPETMERACDAEREAMRRRYVTSTRHTIQVDFFPYLAQLEKETRRARRQGLPEPRPALDAEPRSAA